MTALWHLDDWVQLWASPLKKDTGKLGLAEEGHDEGGVSEERREELSRERGLKGWRVGGE